MANQIEYSVIEFSSDALAGALSNKFVTSDATESKHHFKYFCEYLGCNQDSLCAKTIVTEETYVSQSYLSDYSNYYSLCFNHYDRHCRRVHFFSLEFDRAKFDSALVESIESNSTLWDSYLGYIVVKPLPTKQIGATLLKPYPSTAENIRYYPVQRTYTLNLLGKQLSIETLIFQEQDSIVSACATTALWMAFHKTAYLFHTILPSPNQITSATKNLFTDTGRTFPSKGLDHYQIGNAIESVGLVTELRQYTSGYSLEDVDLPDRLKDAKEFIYGYLRMGLPILLFISIDDIGEHLVTVSGYKKLIIEIESSDEFSLVSTNFIKRLYVHDDQLGPYSRLEFTDSGKLLTGWPKEDNWENKCEATLLSVFVPVSPEIRITYEEVREPTQFFDLAISQLIRSESDIVWDIYLELSNNYKSELVNSDINRNKVFQINIKSLPKYIWISRASIDDVNILELIFDATDLHTGSYCLMINVFNDQARNVLTKWFKVKRNRENLIDTWQLNHTYLDLMLLELNIRPKS